MELTTPMTIKSKGIKKLGIHITKEDQDLHADNYKTSLWKKETKIGGVTKMAE